MDGGVLYHMDTATGIKRCLDITEEKNITIDMVSCSPVVIPYENVTYNAKKVFSRLAAIRRTGARIKQLDYAMEAYPDVNFRHYIRPSTELPLESALDFNATAISASIKIGYQDGKDAAATNENIRDVIKSVKDMPVVFP